MAESFKVGDLCEVIEDAFNPARLGRQCTVMSALKPHPHPRLSYIMVHDIVLQGESEVHWAQPACLRKITPPPQREQTGEWDLCPWRPSVVAVSDHGPKEG